MAPIVGTAIMFPVSFFQSPMHGLLGTRGSYKSLIFRWRRSHPSAWNVSSMVMQRLRENRKSSCDVVGVGIRPSACHGLGSGFNRGQPDQSAQHLNWATWATWAMRVAYGCSVHSLCPRGCGYFSYVAQAPRGGRAQRLAQQRCRVQKSGAQLARSMSFLSRKPRIETLEIRPSVETLAQVCH